MWRASATNENTQGAIQSFVVKQDGSLSEAIATTSSGGNGPAFAIPLSTGEVAAMNVRYCLCLLFIPSLNIYTYVTYSLAREMACLSPPKKTRCSLCRARHSSRSPRRVSRTHTWRWRSGRRSSFRTWYVHAAAAFFVHDASISSALFSFASVPQGADTVWRLARDNSSGTAGAFKITGQIDQPAGSGPRHIVVRGDQLYTLHETASTLTQQTIPATPSSSDAAPPLTANFSIVPPGLPAGAKMAAAEILLAEASSAPGSNFTQPFIYVSNRNVGSALDPRGDAIAIYAVEPELTLVKHVFTGLSQIRGMELSGGDENEFLVAAGVAGDAGVIVMRRTQGGADLEIVASNKDVPTRSSFVWLEGGFLGA